MAELLWGRISSLSVFSNLEFKTEPKEAKTLFLTCFFAYDLLIIVRESCSPFGSLVAARSLSAGETRATHMNLLEGWGVALWLGPLHRPSKSRLPHQQ